MGLAMMQHLHHVHLYASDLASSLAFWCDVLGGRVVLDMTVANARNVFVRVGTGRLHFYDQPPPDPGRGVVHHLGVQTDDLEGLLSRLAEVGVRPRKPVHDFGAWRYAMVAAPDGVLLELFQVRPEAMPDELEGWFETPGVPPPAR
jgi:catechol 2,3-dioxygenase-like lactoylglutathione lyase family enzyme